jgi:CRISPR system Cascade subunit CasC
MVYNFLNLHILFTTGVANMNRDDSGAPKQVVIGGTIRNRFSSQSMTRAKRLMFELGAPGERTTWRAKSGMTDIAVKKLCDLASQSGAPLTDEERSEAEQRIKERISSLVQKPGGNGRASKKAGRATAAAAGQDEGDDEETLTESDTHADADTDGRKDTLVWLAEHEVDKLARGILAELRERGTVENFIERGGRTQSLTIAAFGRMFAFRPDLQNEAAIQRSHAFTTHETSIEPDYFTAVDDLRTAEQGARAGHLDLAQYSSGVYYWHCNIDRRQLWATWIAPDNTDKARKQLADLVEALVVALPSGKQATTAPKTCPDAVLAVPATAPIALHQAFEKPILPRPEGFRERSVTTLLAEHDKVVQFMPRQFSQPAYYAGTVSPHPEPDRAKIRTLDTLDGVIDVIVGWLLAGQPGSKTTEGY